ncbi:MAG: ATP-dependent DNA ligase [Candidatus Micrarchaeota archaeon]
MQFSLLADAYERIEETAGRLDMTAILAELFKSADSSNIDKIIYLTQGVVAPPFCGLEVGMGEKFVEQAIALTSGYSLAQVERDYKKSGDLGKTAENLLKTKKQTALFSESLTVEKVFNSFLKLARTGGEGSQEAKIRALSELLNSCSPKEARYLVRFPIGKLRLGVGDPTIIDALSVYSRGDKSMREELERAYNLCSDLGLIARTFFEDESKLKSFKASPFHPIRPALAERLPSAEEIIAKLGKCSVEHKYDGLRLQVHKKGEKIEIYSRKLEKLTHMFPEIVASARSQIKANDAIFEGEALAYNEESGEYLPFQVTIQRRRKHGIKEAADEFPLMLFAFDLLYADEKDYTREAYSKRREALKKMIKKGTTLQLSNSILTDSASELDAYFNDAISKGLEGIIAKDLNAEYVTGARKFAWIKLKRSYKGELADTLDLVIIGYFLGKGQRAEFKFGGLLCAAYDEDEDIFRTTAKIGSGFSEEQMRELQGMLTKIKLKEKPKNVDSLITPDFWVEPKYVITVSADEITLSPTHTCGKKQTGIGYALRFPRMIGEPRSDKKARDATTVSEIIKMHEMQRRTQLE